MRFYEISSGIRLPVSQEEQELLDAMEATGQLTESTLDERQQEVARLMVSRGLLNRDSDEDETVILRPNNMADVWRM